MTTKFKTLLKTTVAVATLFAGSQSWAATVAATWLNAADGTALVPTGTGPNVPTASSLTYVLSDGSAATAVAIAPADPKVGKILKMTMSAQTTAAPGTVTFTPTTDCVMYLDCAGATSFDAIDFDLINGTHKVTINLLSGRFKLGGAGGTGAVTVKVKEDATIELKTAASSDWNYELTKGKTLTLEGTAPITLTKPVKTNGATIVTPPYACTIPTK
jgi:hypothetical protein